jgi:hypothetical protein
MMNILEGNKLIAEFMGAKFEPEWRFLANLDNPIEPTWVFEVAPTQHSCKNWSNESLQYHESWDWLMPVVEKIENMEVNNVFYEVLIADRCCSISIGKESEHFWVSTGIFECSSKIDAVWQTVVKFIKQTDYV